MPNSFDRELSMWADFNSVDEGRRFTTSLRFTDTPERPAEGELIRLHDDEGNSVMGVVEQIDGMTVHVRPQMETWRSTEISLAAQFVYEAPFRAVTQGEPVDSE
jgi:hypothetical protein